MELQNLDTSWPLLTHAGAIIALFVLVLLLMGVIWHHACKIRRLEQKLVSQHRFMRQELKMMSQGAIGVGNRVKLLEKQVKQTHQPTAFEQLLTQQVDPIPPSSPQPDVAAKPRSEARKQRSRSEQALSDWMRDYQTTA